ncbi:MAG: hypothetical protein ACTHM9_08945 [Gemmatimonadales bacterium]
MTAAAIVGAPALPPLVTQAAEPVGRRREARLRPGFTDRYPGLIAGRWAPAAELADRVLAQALLRRGGTPILGRVLLEAHFEFRYGTARGGERHGVRHHRGS